MVGEYLKEVPVVSLKPLGDRVVLKFAKAEETEVESYCRYAKKNLRKEVVAVGSGKVLEWQRLHWMSKLVIRYFLRYADTESKTGRWV